MQHVVHLLGSMKQISVLSVADQAFHAANHQCLTSLPSTFDRSDTDFQDFKIWLVMEA